MRVGAGVWFVAACVGGVVGLGHTERPAVHKPSPGWHSRCSATAVASLLCLLQPKCAISSLACLALSRSTRASTMHMNTWERSHGWW